MSPISHPTLKEFAISEVKSIFQMGNDPALSVRCAVGDLLVDCTKELGWNWFAQNVSEVLFEWLKTGTSLIKQSAMRTIATFMSISPPQEILSGLREAMDELAKDPLAIVQSNAAYCLERCRFVNL